MVRAYSLKSSWNHQWISWLLKLLPMLPVVPMAGWLFSQSHTKEHSNNGHPLLRRFLAAGAQKFVTSLFKSSALGRGVSFLGRLFVK